MIARRQSVVVRCKAGLWVVDDGPDREYLQCIGRAGEEEQAEDDWNYGDKSRRRESCSHKEGTRPRAEYQLVRGAQPRTKESMRPAARRHRLPGPHPRGPGSWRGP